MARNLTHERQLTHLKRQRDQELALVQASETVVETVVKNPGAKVPEFVDRRVSKREFLAREHNDRIALFAAAHGLSV